MANMSASFSTPSFSGLATIPLMNGLRSAPTVSFSLHAVSEVVEMDGGIDRFKFDTFRFLTLNDAQRNLSQRGNVTAHGVRVECHFLDTFVQLVQLVFRHLARHHGTYRRIVEPFLDDGQIVQVGQFGIDARLRVGNRLDVAFKLLF